jgi:hypothetical protein
LACATVEEKKKLGMRAGMTRLFVFEFSYALFVVGGDAFFGVFALKALTGLVARARSTSPDESVRG